MKKKVLTMAMVFLMAFSLSACSKTVTGDDIADYAKQFIGFPYESGGTSLTEGCDSSGFVASVLAHFGIVNKKAAKNHGYVINDLGELGTEVSADELEAGDILIYQTTCAIYLGDSRIVYSKNSIDGILIERLDDVETAFGGLVTARRVTKEG